jgi:predicted thioesterase
VSVISTLTYNWATFEKECFSDGLAEVLTHVVEVLATGLMVPSGTNSSPAEVSTHVVEVLATGRMVPSGTNSSPSRQWFIRYIFIGIYSS